MKQNRHFCLASASPRRKELLANYGFTFDVVPADVDEWRRPDESPEALVARLAEAKARAVARQRPDAVVIAGDTIVVLGRDVLGKPGDAAEGRAMLRRLSGQTHRVLSAYCLLGGPEGELVADTVETRVIFRELPEAWIDWYTARDEMRDKAGAYAIQGFGGMMVERIEGSYTNVVGFPIEAIVWALIRQGWVTL